MLLNPASLVSVITLILRCTCKACLNKSIVILILHLIRYEDLDSLFIERLYSLTCILVLLCRVFALSLLKIYVKLFIAFKSQSCLTSFYAHVSGMSFT